MRAPRKTTLQQQLAAQERWIAEHGGTERGYVRLYGSRQDPDHQGDGGEAIWAADSAELRRLQALALAKSDVAWLKGRRTLAMKQARAQRRRWEAGGHETVGGSWVEYTGRDLDAIAAAVARNVRDARFHNHRIIAVRKGVKRK